MRELCTKLNRLIKPLLLPLRFVILAITGLLSTGTSVFRACFVFAECEFFCFGQRDGLTWRASIVIQGGRLAENVIKFRCLKGKTLVRFYLSKLDDGESGIVIES